MIRQISVFLENRAGKLSEALAVLAEKNVDLRALNIAEATDYGLLRLIVADHDTAEEVLKEKGYVSKESPVVCIAVPDRPGGLSEALSVLTKEGINVYYMYSIFSRKEGKAYMVMRVRETEEAERILGASGIHVATPEELEIR